MIDPGFPCPKKKARVNGYRMAYAQAGDANGDPIIFLHGNATSSYMWRNIMPIWKVWGGCSPSTISGACPCPSRPCL